MKRDILGKLKGSLFPLSRRRKSDLYCMLGLVLFVLMNITWDAIKPTQLVALNMLAGRSSGG